MLSVVQFSNSLVYSVVQTRKKISGYSRYLSNTSWLLAAKVYRMTFALLITIWMARYLGPEQFGIFNYALSFVTLFSVLVSLGMDKLIVRELLNKPEEEGNILASALIIRVVGAFFLMVFASLLILEIRPNDQLMFALVLVFSFGFFFKAFELMRYWFEAHVKGKYSSLIEVIAVTCSISGKLILILIDAPLIYFAWTVAVETVVMALCLFVFYVLHGGSFAHWKPKFAKIRFLLLEAWPLILAGTLYVIYTKVDQIMLGEMVGLEAVGIYAAAVKLSEGWFFVPVVIATSLFPAMLNAKKKSRELYLERTQHLLNLMVIIGLLAAICISLIAYPVVVIAFGPSYTDAAWILMVHIWGGIFLAMSSVSYRFFIAEGLQKYSFYRGLTGLFVNLFLNLWLIPLFGAMGAAIATVVSQAMALYLFNAGNSKTREIFIMQTRALLLIGSWATLKHIKKFRTKT